jgi:long-chain acyl-CoA synthetase
MVGYFNNPEATNKVLINGWLHTGDIAREDEEGFVKIVGRKKSMINSGGFAVQPEEIEEIMLRVPEIDECKVVGMYDSILTEKIVACIKTKPEREVNDLGLYKFLRENLEPEKVPHEIHFIENFPRGISGKIQVEELKKLIVQKQPVQVDKSADILETVLKNAADVFRVNHAELTEQSSTKNVPGWDSLNHLALINRLEQVFNVKFSTSDTMVMNTIQSIHTVVNKKIK